MSEKLLNHALPLAIQREVSSLVRDSGPKVAT